MVSKCANPACSASFHSLGEGRLFQVSSDDPRLTKLGCAVDQKKPTYKVEFFWLCGSCSKTLTIHIDENRQARTIPIEAELRPARVRASAG